MGLLIETSKIEMAMRNCFCSKELDDGVSVRDWTRIDECRAGLNCVKAACSGGQKAWNL